MFNPAEVLDSPAFKSALASAQDYMIDREKASALIAQANVKIKEMENSRGPVGEAVRSARAGVRMIEAYVHGRYRVVPVKSLASVVGAVLYFLRDDDIIPDSTPFIGYADDAAVIMLALKMVQGDLEAFEAWEATQPAAT